MRAVLRHISRIAAIITLFLPATAHAGVVNNVLLQWREQTDKCEDAGNVIESIIIKYA